MKPSPLLADDDERVQTHDLEAFRLEMMLLLLDWTESLPLPGYRASGANVHHQAGFPFFPNGMLKEWNTNFMLVLSKPHNYIFTAAPTASMLTPNTTLQSLQPLHIS